MNCCPHVPRAIIPMPLIFRSRRSFLNGYFLLVMSIVVLTGANSTALLTAQQADVYDPGQSAFSTAEAAASAPDSAPRAPVPAGPSSSSSAAPPQDQSAQDAPADSSGQQTRRILGIIPNFRAVSAGTKLPPETVKEKFIDATEDSFDYSSIFIPSVLAAYNMHERTTPEFHEGAAGYTRYLWHSAVDQTSENYFVEFIFPTITREDARYYTLGHGGFLKRTGYALSRAVITRSNSGNEVFNMSEIFGAGASAGVSKLYYPSASRSAGNTMSQWAEDVGIDAAASWFKEFWPDINRHIFRNKNSDASAQ